jgi:DNA replication protein DnaC
MYTDAAPFLLAQNMPAGADSKHREGVQGMKVSTEVCPLCEGTGWKTISKGTDRRVTRCDCQLRARSQTLLAAARIPRRYEHCELAEFDTHFQGANSTLQWGLLEAKSFVASYPVEKSGLLMMGPVGVGKTHLSVGILRELILKKGIACLFYDYRELLKEIQNSYNDSVKVTELEVLRPVFETEVLVLDELGAVRPTEWVWDTVSLILNTRYNDNRTTIITTNYPDEAGQDPYANPASEFARAQRAMRRETLGDRIGERMRSRLYEMCRILKLEGADFRKIRSASFR